MSEAVVIEQFVEQISPVYRGRFNGMSLTIKLDSSAILKLSGESTDVDPIVAFVAKRQDVAAAAQRLIEMRQFNTVADEMMVIISALDLD